MNVLYILLLIVFTLNKEEKNSVFIRFSYSATYIVFIINYPSMKSIYLAEETVYDASEGGHKHFLHTSRRGITLKDSSK